MAQRRERGGCGRCTGVGVSKRRREVGDGGSSSDNGCDAAATNMSTAASSCAVGGHLDYPSDLRAILGNMLDDPQLSALSDVVIIVEGCRFPAHRAVLAAASNVFRAMFTNEMKESVLDEVELKGISAQSWRMALQYIYTAQVEIADEPTALLLLESARMYQLETLESFVENFLISRLNVSNCFELLGHAEHYDLEELKRETKNQMQERFEAVASSPSFPACPYELIEELLSCRKLVIRSEMQLFYAIDRWCSAPERGGEYVERLIRLVDLGELQENELKEIAKHKLARQVPAFREQVLERLLHSTDDPIGDGLLAAGWHLKPRVREATVFTFAHQQRGMTVSSSADDEEVVRTPWAKDNSGRIVWRLKIYPRGYNKAKGHYLSMYVQARSAMKSDKLDLNARFDIFLINRKEAPNTISFSSQHRFTEQSDHWGFHRFLPLGQMTDPNGGFIDVESDSVLVGANIYY